MKAVIALFAAVMIISCSASSADPQPGDTVRPIDSGRTTTEPGDRRDELESLRLELEDARKNAIAADPGTSSEIKAVIDDGVLTFSEYESSVLAMAACVREAGGVFYREDQPKLTWRGLYIYSTGFPEAVPGARAAVNGCVERHVGILDLLWKEVTNPSRKEEEEAMHALARCLSDIGLEHIVPEGRRREDFEMLGPKLSEDDRALYMSCAQRIGEEYALPYFGPTY